MDLPSKERGANIFKKNHGIQTPEILFRIKLLFFRGGEMNFQGEDPEADRSGLCHKIGRFKRECSKTCSRVIN